MRLHAVLRSSRTHELRDSSSFVLRREVRVPLSHLVVAVPEQLADRVQVDADHNELGREGVAQIMPPEPADLRCGENALP